VTKTFWKRGTAKWDSNPKEFLGQTYWVEAGHCGGDPKG